MHLITHVIGGCLIGSIFSAVLGVGPPTYVYFFCGLLASVPDLDIFCGRPVFRQTSYRPVGLQHRCGLSHSLYTVIAPLLFVYLAPYWSIMASLSLFSHWLLDSFNYIGVRSIAIREFKAFLIKHKCDVRFAKSNAWSFKPNLLAILALGGLFLIFPNFFLYLMGDAAVRMGVLSIVVIMGVIIWVLAGRGKETWEGPTIAYMKKEPASN